MGAANTEENGCGETTLMNTCLHAYPCVARNVVQQSACSAFCRFMRKRYLRITAPHSERGAKKTSQY